MLDVIAQKIIWEDGEGLIARRKSSVYENGRSESLIKIKVDCPPKLDYHSLS